MLSCPGHGAPVSGRIVWGVGEGVSRGHQRVNRGLSAAEGPASVGGHPPICWRAGQNQEAEVAGPSDGRRAETASDLCAPGSQALERHRWLPSVRTADGGIRAPVTGARPSSALFLPGLSPEALESTALSHTRKGSLLRTAPRMLSLAFSFFWEGVSLVQT